MTSKRVACLQIVGVLLIAVIATSALAQATGTDRHSRQWASESVEALTKSRDADKRVEAAKYLGSFTYPDVIPALGAALGFGLFHVANEREWSTHP